MFKLPEKLKSKYEFVTLAAKRAEQLQSGALPRVDRESNKVTVISSVLPIMMNPFRPPVGTQKSLAVVPVRFTCSP